MVTNTTIEETLVSVTGGADVVLEVGAESMEPGRLAATVGVLFADQAIASGPGSAARASSRTGRTHDAFAACSRSQRSHSVTE